MIENLVVSLWNFKDEEITIVGKLNVEKDSEIWRTDVSIHSVDIMSQLHL